MIKVMVVLMLATPVTAQIPDTFTNLQHFPKDVTREQLIGAMRGFSFALGVRCQHCHAGGPAFDKMDFASDDKEPKRVARKMLAMVEAINEQHVGKLGRAEHVSVRCATCHAGIPRPEPIESIFRAELESSGFDVATQRYRELREEFHGSASYDFSESPLNQLGERLLRSGNAATAVNILQLNAEYHDDSTWLSNLLGQAHLENGDRDSARAAFEHSLSVNPEDRAAKKQLEELDAARN